MGSFVFQFERVLADQFAGFEVAGRGQRVSAEDNQGIGGYERVMGPNGQAQYFARDIGEACQLLFRHHDHTYIAPGERFPRRAVTNDAADRDVRVHPYARREEHGFATVGDVLTDAGNPGRKKPFDVRIVMQSVADQDHPTLERWSTWRHAETVVVWDAHLGGWPVCLLGIESEPLPRFGIPPAALSSGPGAPSSRSPRARPPGP